MGNVREIRRGKYIQYKLSQRLTYVFWLIELIIYQIEYRTYKRLHVNHSANHIVDMSFISHCRQLWIKNTLNLVLLNIL